MRFSPEHNFVSDIIRYPNELASMSDIVPIQAINDPALQRIYETVIDLWSSGEAVSELTIYKKLKCDVVFLSQLTDKIPQRNSIPVNAKIIEKEYQRRRLETELTHTIQKNKTCDPSDTIKSVSEILSAGIYVERKDNSSKAVVDRYTETQKHNAEHGIGIDTGFMCYEDKFIRYCPNHVWVVGGFTSTGKTAKMIEMIYRGHSAGMVSTIISTEMSEDQNINRLLARITGFNQNYLFSGRIKKEHIELVNAAKAKIASWDIEIHDSIYELQDIEMCARRSFLQRKVGVIFIDYAQNIVVPDAKSEYQEATRIGKTVQRIAKMCKCTVVLLSQLSNSAAKDDDGLLQFKGSGTYSSVADIGIILKRYKDENSNMNVDVRKNRHGALMTQVIQFTDHWTRLKEIPHSDNR